MAQDVIALMDGLTIDSAHIVGISMGGFIAQLLAAEYSSRVLSMTSIMSGSGPVDPTLIDALWTVRRPRETVIQEWVEYVRQQPLTVAIRPTAPIVNCWLFSPKKPQWIGSELSQCRPWWFTVPTIR